MRVLLTAFEPFDGTGWNSSEVACRQLLEWSTQPDDDVRFTSLPVAYGEDTRALELALSADPVDLLLHTGQAAGSAAVRVERLAVNVRYAAHAVGIGPAAPQQVIDAGGPAAFFSTAPVEAMVAAIHGAGIPAVLSNHAGIYLCNHVLYCSLQRAQLENATHQVAFLHVPYLPAQVGPDQPSMDADRIAAAIRAAIDACRIARGS